MEFTRQPSVEEASAEAGNCSAASAGRQDPMSEDTTSASRLDGTCEGIASAGRQGEDVNGDILESTAVRQNLSCDGRKETVCRQEDAADDRSNAGGLLSQEAIVQCLPSNYLDVDSDADPRNGIQLLEAGCQLLRQVALMLSLIRMCCHLGAL